MGCITAKRSAHKSCALASCRSVTLNQQVALPLLPLRPQHRLLCPHQLQLPLPVHQCHHPDHPPRLLRQFKCPSRWPRTAHLKVLQASYTQPGLDLGFGMECCHPLADLSQAGGCCRNEQPASYSVQPCRPGPAWRVTLVSNHCFRRRDGVASSGH